MNYEKAQGLLTGRCKNRHELANNTYLERRDDGTVAIKLYSTDILTFHEDGRIDLSMGGYNTVTTQDRINRYLEHGRVWTESGYLFLNWMGKKVGISDDATLYPDGRIVGKGVVSAAAQRNTIAEAHRERVRLYARSEEAKRRRRERYWIRKARGVFIDRTGCKAVGGYYCDSRKAWNRRNLLRGKPMHGCGCKVVRRPPSARGLSVGEILAETNASVRVAKMTCYGIDRFFTEANPRIIDSQAGYQLVEIPVAALDENATWRERARNVPQRALKMTCPSTGAVYVNTVPPDTVTVPLALDWMFDTVNYLGTVTQQT